MGTPITWHNVNGPSLGDPSVALARAQQAILGGLDSFGNTLKQQGETEAANWEIQKKNNTENFLAAMNAAKSAEDFTKLKDSGVLDQMLASSGAQIDKAAVRSALDARLGVLQQRDVAGVAYKNTMQDEAEAADNRRIAMLALTNPAAAKALLEEKANLRAAPQLAKSIQDSERATEKFGWDRENARFAAEQHPLQITKLNNDINMNDLDRDLKKAQAAKLNAEAILDKARAEAAKAASTASGTPSSAALDKAYKEYVANMEMDKGGIDTTAGKEELFKGLKAMDIGEDAKQDILYNIDKYFRKGIPITDANGNKHMVPVPVSLVLEAAGAASENPLAAAIPGWSRKGDEVAERIAQRFGLDTSRSLGSTGNVFVSGDNAKYKDAALIDRLLGAASLRAARDSRLDTPAISQLPTDPKSKKR